MVRFMNGWGLCGISFVVGFDVVVCRYDFWCNYVLVFVNRF